MSPILTTGAGTYSAVVAGFTGPMNIAGYTAPYACWSLRAATTAIAAAATQNLIDITDQSDLNPLTVKCTTSGDLDTAAINTWVTAHSVSTIKVSKIYDQSGNGRDMVQIAVGLNPTLLLNTLNGKAVVFFSSSSGTTLNTGSVPGATAQPFTFSGVVQPVVGTSNQRMLCNTSGLQFGFDTTSGFMYAGTSQSFTPINGWQSAIAVFNDPSSATVNCASAGTNPSGTPTTLAGSTGADTLTAGNGFSLNSRNPGTSDLPANFNMLEMIVTMTAVSSGNQASLIANQRAYGAY